MEEKVLAMISSQQNLTRGLFRIISLPADVMGVLLFAGSYNVCRFCTQQSVGPGSVSSLRALRACFNPSVNVSTTRYIFPVGFICFNPR